MALPVADRDALRTVSRRLGFTVVGEAEWRAGARRLVAVPVGAQQSTLHAPARRARVASSGGGGPGAHRRLPPTEMRHDELTHVTQRREGKPHMQYLRMFTGADDQTQFEQVAVPGTPGGGGGSALSAPIPVLGVVFARLAAGYMRPGHNSVRRI